MGHWAYLTTLENRYILGLLLKIIWVHWHSSAVKKLKNYASKPTQTKN
jgi:hypothetical protein